MLLSFITLDVFTTSPFRGNPVAIIQIPAGTKLSQEQKQNVASEFNLSESVFLHEQTDADREGGDVRIDIFTPIAEVPFAGHPTVGTANYLLRYLNVENVRALQAKAGRIPIALSEDCHGIQLAVAHDVHVHQQPFGNRDFGHLPVVSIVKGMTFILARLETLEELMQQSKNLLGPENTYKSHSALDEGWQVGIVTTYFYVDLNTDHAGIRQLRTRNFGSREDPATGSAASALCSYLSLIEKDHDRLRRYHLTQGVEMGRQSHISVEVRLTEDSSVIEQVSLSGTAVKVIEGKIEVA